MPDILREKIKHVVVLMLENRSFDSMLGRVHLPSDSFDGLTGQESNPDPAGGTTPILVWNQPATGTPLAMNIPDPDPGELWTDINTQIFGSASPQPGVRPTMQGFTQNYVAQTKPGSVCDARDIMHYYDAGQLPVMYQLARQFAVCDRWFASAPCQTWPNRFFAHTGTANGYENNSPPHFPYAMPTVFGLMGPGEWKIYYHDFPQSLTLSELWPHIGSFRFFDEFLVDARNGTLPSYSFIEPRYFPDLHLPNDQHPPHVVTLGEQLIADIYNALRSNEQQWQETLLIVTYDEHGGLYDHVPPPNATPPSSTPSAPFKFDRYGVRVPALLISPYIRPGTVLRPPGDTPFDHTSIISTLRWRFGLRGPLTARDGAAPHVGGVLNLATPDNGGPQQIARPVYSPTPAELVAALDKAPNDLQRALADIAAHLPNSGPTKPSNLVAFVATHVLNLGANPPTPPAPQSVSEAANYVKNELNDFLRVL